MMPKCGIALRTCSRAAQAAHRALPIVTARMAVRAPTLMPSRTVPIRYLSATRILSTSSTVYTAAHLDTNVYHRLTDVALDDLSAQLEELVETVDLDGIEEARGSGASASDWDIEYAVSPC